VIAATCTPQSTAGDLSRLQLSAGVTRDLTPVDAERRRQLPESMKRAMARQAEAEPEKRAKIIAAEGEALAAGELGHASDVMMAHPLALQFA
jgi:regulator of protease activity HflC (stomatin/prohibitin superfamily)